MWSAAHAAPASAGVSLLVSRFLPTGEKSNYRIILQRITSAKTRATAIQGNRPIPPNVSPNDMVTGINCSKEYNKYLYTIIEGQKMLTKEKVKKTIDRLPESFTVDQVVEELVVLDKIEKGLKEVEEGKVYTTKQVKDQLKKWL